MKNRKPVNRKMETFRAEIRKHRISRILEWGRSKWASKNVQAEKSRSRTIEKSKNKKVEESKIGKI